MLLSLSGVLTKAGTKIVFGQIRGICGGTGMLFLVKSPILYNQTESLGVFLTQTCLVLTVPKRN